MNTIVFKNWIAISFAILALVGCERAEMSFVRPEGLLQSTTKTGKVFADAADVHWIAYISNYEPDHFEGDDKKKDWKQDYLEPLQRLSDVYRLCGIKSLSFPNCNDHDFKKYSAVFYRQLGSGQRVLKATLLQDAKTQLVYFVVIEKRLMADGTTQVEGSISVMPPSEPLDPEQPERGVLASLSELAELAGKNIQKTKTEILNTHELVQAMSVTTIGSIYSGEQSGEHFLEELLNPSLQLEVLYSLLNFLAKKSEFNMLKYRIENRVRLHVNAIVKDPSEDLKSKFILQFRSLFSEHGTLMAEFMTALAFEDSYQQMPGKLIAMAMAAQRLLKEQLSMKLKSAILSGIEKGTDGTALVECIKAVRRHGKDLVQFVNLKKFIKKQEDLGARSLALWGLYAVQPFFTQDAHLYLLDVIANSEQDSERARYAAGSFNIRTYDKVVERETIKRLAKATSKVVKEALQGILARLEDLKKVP